MKVKPVTHLLSKSVANTLKFCKNKLNIEELVDVDSASNILISRSITLIILQTLLKYLLTTYVKHLNKYNNFIPVPVLESNKKTSFIGTLVCLNSLLQLHYKLIATGVLEYFKLYKISQDYLELYFGTIRAQGYNNNPTARKFQSAYKTLVIRVNDIESFNTGNYIPLEHIDILNYSSSDPIKVINSSSNNYNNKLDLMVSEQEKLENDAVESYINIHDCKPNEYTISNFLKEITIYIAVFVVYK